MDRGDVVIWWSNGDHPLDGDSPEEGSIVRYFRHPDYDDEDLCPVCNLSYHEHGWIDQRSGGTTVCPGSAVSIHPSPIDGQFSVEPPSRDEDGFTKINANVAQLVEHCPSKSDVEGSSPFIRSIVHKQHAGTLSDIVVYTNNTYRVVVCDRVLPEQIGDMTYVTHVAVSLNDGGKDVLWQDLQAIKNAVLGDDTLAFQVFPPEDMLTDMANVYHLVCIPEEFRSTLMPLAKFLNAGKRLVSKT